ncbi:MAG: aminotransferase class I/II-fold pyridoxal phosphate-dependent enzyme [Candidatus Bipolaricaulia bacterium]
MKLEIFEMERLQSKWENRVQYNLSESGIHPLSLKELLSEDEVDELLSLRLGYNQTNGTEALREKISHLYPGTDADNILVTNGSAEANFISIWSQIEPGDELIFMVPNYMQIWGLARSLAAVVKPFHLRQELNWAPDLEELKQLISSRTKMIVLCNPNNPTGATLSEKSMEEIVRLAENVGAWILCDEVYRGAELTGEETPTFWGCYEKVIVSHGLSKAYSLPGLRIGWSIGPKKLIETSWAYHDYLTIAPGIMSDRLARLALEPEMRRKILARSRKILTANLNSLKAWLNRYPDLFELVPPRAGAIAFIRYNLEINSTQLVMKLLHEKSVLVVPGNCFGLDHFIRLGYGVEKDYLLAGLGLIDETLRELSDHAR